MLATRIEHAEPFPVRIPKMGSTRRRKIFLDANVVIRAGKPPGGPLIKRVADLGDAQKQLNRVLSCTDFDCLRDSCLRRQRLYRFDDRRITPPHPV